jgi:hypothetical protein
MDPELGSVLGRLGLFGEINERQVEAGRYFARIVACIERKAGYQKRSPASPQYEAGFRLNLIKTNDAPLGTERKLRALQREFENLRMVLYDDHTREVIEEVCCNDHEINSLEFPLLRSGLTALAGHLKLPDKKNESRVAIPPRAKVAHCKS